MFLNSMASLLGSLTIALVIAQEDVFQARLVAGQANDSILRCCFNYCICSSLDSQTQRMPTRQYLYLFYPIQRLERFCRDSISERDRDFVVFDVLEFGHDTHAHQLPRSEEHTSELQSHVN